METRNAKGAESVNLSVPFRPNLPMLLDSGSVLAPRALIGSQYLGRIFYLKRADWTATRFPDYISESEADAYKRYDKSIVLNFEDAAPNWCLGGYERGLDRGNVAAQQLAEIGCENAAVYMSVDFQPRMPRDVDAVMECLRGFQESALGSRGRAVYGFAPTLREARKRGLADYYWLCGDGRRLYPEHEGGQDSDLRDVVNIWQQNNEQPIFAGVQVDDNYIYTPGDYGQWLPGDWKDRKVANADEVMTQLFGKDGKGWAFLGKSHIDPTRDATLPEAVGKVLDQLGGPDHNFGGWSQLAGLTLVDALSVLGWFFSVPGFEPTAGVKEKLQLTEEKRFKNV